MTDPYINIRNNISISDKIYIFLTLNISGKVNIILSVLEKLWKM